VVGQRTRLVNQLHALLRDLVPGGAPVDLSVAAARRVLLGVRPAGPVESVRKQIARDLIAEVADCDARLAALTKQIAAAVEQSGSRLVAVDGVGPVVAARLLGRTGNASRFRSAAAFAMHSVMAPIEVASAEKSRHRLPRGGDRQLNYALHIVALTQVRMRASRGRAYYESKIAQGKTRNEAMRCPNGAWRTTSGGSWLPTNDRRRVREDTRGRLPTPARLTQPHRSTLRRSHSPVW